MIQLLLAAILCCQHPEIGLYEDYILEKEDPEHHYGTHLVEAYHKFRLEQPHKTKEEFFSFVQESGMAKVIYLETPEEQKENIIHINSEAKVLEKVPTEIPLMFEMDVNGQYYAHEKIRANSTTQGFHHATFTAAKGVAYAGTIKIAPDGTIEWISDDSGHFRPLSDSLISLLKNLEKEKIPLDKIQLFLRRTTAPVNAIKWLEAYQKYKDPIPGENVLQSNR